MVVNNDQRTEVVIVGAGFAGASTAMALAARGVRRVTILESESIPGRHGSGLNAAIARRVIDEPVTARLATEGMEGILALEEESGQRLLDPVGGILLGTESHIERHLSCVEGVPELVRDITRISVAEAEARVPNLKGIQATSALHVERSGTVDIHGLLLLMLDKARAGGATLRLSCPLTDVHTSGGRVVGVETTDGPISCDVVVNAAGFGMNRVAALAGLSPLNVNPARRHLFVTEAMPEVDRRWPWVADGSHGYYFRPEGAGLLMSACDQTPWPPEPPPTDPAVRDLLAERFATHVPGLAHARPAHSWAGLRVLTPDDRFAIGPEPGLEGFMWVAGLGGHGMTTSCRVGALAAEAIERGRMAAPYDVSLEPTRLR